MYIDPNGQNTLVIGAGGVVAVVAIVLLYKQYLDIVFSDGIHIGPWPGSTTNPDAEDAGDEAAEEIEAEGLCPVDTDNPSECRDAIRNCRQKCQNKGSPGSGGNYSEWLGRCVLRYTSKLGCSNIVF